MPLHVGAEAFGGKHEHGGHEFAVLAHAALEPYGQIVRKGHGVSLDDEVDVDIRPLEAFAVHDEIAHEAAHHVHRRADVVSDFAGHAQKVETGSRKALAHHGNEIAFLAGLAAHRRNVRAVFAHEQADDVGSGDHAHHGAREKFGFAIFVVEALRIGAVHHGNEPLLTAHHDVHEFLNAGALRHHVEGTLHVHATAMFASP